MDKKSKVIADNSMALSPEYLTSLAEQKFKNLWMREAVRAGFPPMFIIKGQWTPDELRPAIEGYYQSLRDRGVSLRGCRIPKDARSK